MYRSFSKLFRKSKRRQIISRPNLVSLEARDCPAITFQFDYRFDTSGYFTAERKALLERAGATIGSLLNDQFAAILPSGGNSWTATTRDPSQVGGADVKITNLTVPANTAIIFAAASDQITELANARPETGFDNPQGDATFINAILSRGQSGIVDAQNNYLPANKQTDTAFWGGSIQFGSKTKFYESLNPRDPNNPATSGSDFFDTAVHELGHIFGIGTSPVWTNKIQDTGGGKLVFTGANTVARNGGVPVPIEAAPVQAHWADGTLDGGKFAGLNISDDSFTYRNLFSQLDFAALKDLGWEVATDTDGNIATATATGFSTGGTGVAKTAKIDIGPDVDMYSFTGTAGNVVTISTSQPAGQVAVDTFLRVFDATGKQLDADDNSGGNNYSKLIFTVPANGTYYVGVSAAPNTVYQPEDTLPYERTISGSTGDYTLTIGDPVVGAPVAPTAVIGTSPTIDQTYVGTTKYEFTVVYTANTAGTEIDGASLSSANIKVTGPLGFNAPITFVSATPGPGNGSPLTVTYRFDPPGGTWDVTDNGTYDIAVLGSQVKDTAGNFVVGAALKSLAVNFTGGAADTTAPTAKLKSALNVNGQAGDKTAAYSFTVTYTDDVAVNAGTFDGKDIRVTGPNGFNQLATFAFADVPGNDVTRTATYRLTPPGGAWNLADNGTYTIAVEGNEVSDVAGNFVTAGTLGTFTVTVTAPVPGAPTATLQNAPAIDDAFANTATYTFEIVYDATAPNLIDATSISDKNIVITGPGGFSENAKFVSSVPFPGNFGTITATYQFTAPGGKWDKTDNGDYQIAVAASQVKDTNGVFVGATTLRTLTATLTNTLVGGSSGPVVIGYTGFGVGADAGGGGKASLRVGSFGAQSEIYAVTPFAGFTGAIRTAAADFNGDGFIDLVVATGPGTATQLKILDGQDSSKVLFELAPFEAAFTGGIFVAAGDITGDGTPDFVVTPDEGGGPRCRVFNGKTFTQIVDFFGIDDQNFRGGARAAISDISGDGKADLLVAAGFGGGPRLALYDGSKLADPAHPKFVGDFFVFEQSLRNGVFLAAGDVSGDGYADIIVGGGPGGGPRVFGLSGKDITTTGTQTQVANFFAGDPNSRGGVRLAMKDLDSDNKSDILTGTGTGAGSKVVAYLGKDTAANGTPTESFSFDAFPGFTGGVFVG